MSAEQTSTWERKILEKAVLAATREQRRARFWSILFRFLFLIYFIVILVFIAQPLETGAGDRRSEHVARIDVTGIIAPTSRASAAALIRSLHRAYDEDNVTGIILNINSPGGSPVQSALIYDEIMHLRSSNPDKPLVVVIADVGASGAYYIAAAGERIYANRASIVGSIGVIMSGFGFTDLIDEYGIERRVFTSGTSKDDLDPFRPLTPEATEHVQTILDSVHNTFINDVVAGRDGKLDPNNDELFSGLYWDGLQAKDLGLVDDFGGVGDVAMREFNTDNIVSYTPQFNFLERLSMQSRSWFQGLMFLFVPATVQNNGLNYLENGMSHGGDQAYPNAYPQTIIQ